jgi:glutamate racemase
MTALDTKSPTIGVFDSGFGGLTVLRALLPLISGAHYIYLGDTARLPYGSKSRETIARYAVSSARFLHQQGADILVIACNTATAMALEDIQRALPIPVIGVIEPGAQAALRSFNESAPEEKSSIDIQDQFKIEDANAQRSTSPSFRPERTEVEKPASLPQPAGSPQNQVVVLATAATVQSHAYTHALNDLGLQASEKACPLLVPLVEEGWINHPVTDDVLKIYLAEALSAAPAAETLLLGCTHYPLIEPAVHRTLKHLGHDLTVIDSADATARAAANLVDRYFPNLTTAPPTCTFYATDSIEKFQRLGSNFLGQPVTNVNLIDLGD